MRRLGIALVLMLPAALQAQTADSARLAAGRDTAACVPQPRVVPQTGPLYFEYQVQRPAKPQGRLPEPVAPTELAGKPGRRGTAQMLFVVDTAGRVEPSTITVVQSTEPRLGEAACQALREALFTPATLQGRRVRMWYQTTFRF